MPTVGTSGVAARTRVVDAQVALAIGRGIDQIILLGAGYDGRSLRFGGGSVRWFEVDRPATLADKARRLGALGHEATGVVFVGVDLLGEDVGAALGAAAHERDRPSLFVCEGLLRRLSLEATAGLCHALRGRAAPSSVLVADCRVAPDTGAPARALRRTTDVLLAAVGEPRRNEFRPGDPEKLMVVTGWRMTQMESAAESRLDRGSHTVVLVCEPV